GFVFDTNLTIAGLVSDAAFHFEIEQFSFVENTDPLTFLIPNFRATASVSRLAIPGLSGSAALVSLDHFLLDLTKGPGGLSLVATGSLSMLGVNSLSISGNLNLSSQGLYADFELRGHDGATTLAFGGSGYTLSGTSRLQINTTNGTRLGIPAFTSRVTVNGSLQLYVSGNPAFSVSGGFEMSTSPAGLHVGFSGTAHLGLFGSFGVGGSLGIATDGIYGNLVIGGRSIYGNGFTLSGDLQLEINTTGSWRAVSGFTVNSATGGALYGQQFNVAPNSVKVTFGGNLSFANGFNIAGRVVLSGSGGVAGLSIDGNMNVFGLSLRVAGSANIYGADWSGSGGVVINMALTHNGSSTVTFSAGGFSFTGSVKLLVNSSNTWREGLGPGTYAVEVSGASFSFMGFTASGSFYIGLSNGVFSVSVPSWSPLTMDFFGFGRISLTGSFDSSGNYNLSASASINLYGEIWVPNPLDWFKNTAKLYGSINVSGTLSFSNNHFSASVSGSGSVGAEVYNWLGRKWEYISVSASASASLYISNKDLRASLSVSLDGFPWPLNKFPPLKLDLYIGRMPDVPPPPPSIYSFSVPTFGTEGHWLTSSVAASPWYVNYSWHVFRDGVYTGLTGAGSTFSFIPGDQGSYEIRATATDPNTSKSTSLSSLAVVNNANPAITAFSVPSTFTPGQNVTVSASASDPAGANDSLSYTWTVLKNGNPFITGSGASFTFKPDAAATYSVALVVADEDGGTARREVTLADGSPNITSFTVPATGFEASPITVSASATTAGGSGINYNWSILKNGAPFTTGAGASFTFTPNDNGQYLVSLQAISQSSGLSATRNAIVDVRNVDPTITGLVAPATGIEGSPITVTGSAIDPAGANDALSYQWRVELNGRDFAQGSGANYQFTPSDDGTYIVRLQVADEDGGISTSSQASIVVGNVAPGILLATGNQTLAEGQLLNFPVLAYFSDPGFDHLAAGTAETITFTVAWGDGTSDSGTGYISLRGGPGVLTEGHFGTEHVYADNGNYTVTVTVRDDDGGSVSRSFNVAVTNQAVTIDPGPNQTVNEGSLIELSPAIFIDPGSADTHWATINWGDGSPVQTAELTESPFGPPGLVGGAGGVVFGTHVYADNGNYTVTITVWDDDGAVSSASFVATVLNVAPTITVGGNQIVNEGLIVSLPPGTFHDFGTADTHAASIDWGDGSAVQAGLVFESPFGPGGSTAGASGTFASSHVYADNGTYLVRVTFWDDDGGTAQASFYVTVNNVAPTLNAGPDQVVFEGRIISLPPALFNDLGTLDSHTATINWGDGTLTEAGLVTESPFGPPGSTTGANGTIAGQHVYADNGVYTVTVTVTDDDGATTVDTLTVVVLNVAPTLNAGL
ncbi:MAG: PKD domain-containing protein, partial [Verrucomicrobiota bacterium]